MKIGDRVAYRNVNLTYKGTVTAIEDSFVYVAWDGMDKPSKEWRPNLKILLESTK